MTSGLYIRIPVKTSMPELRVWFYDPSYDSEGVFNRLVASLDGPFCHVELQFADACACSIYMGCEVTMKIRSFSSDNYTCVSIPCTITQELRARSFAEIQTSNRVQFSTIQMSSCVTWFQATNDPAKTFCSKLVAETLQAAGIIPDTINSCQMSPSALYWLLLPIAESGQAKQTSQRVPAIDFKSSY